MIRRLLSLVMLAGLALPVLADEPAAAPDALPAGIRRFNGMLVGRVAAKDVERGSFTLQVDAVPRVWKNSAAEDPRSIVGKTVEISGVFGKFLDVLVVTRVGETIEFECKHDGERLVFPGELLRKVAPYDPADYPVLPEAFRGFQGVVAAEVIKKDPETFELILRVDQVLQTGEDNQAKEAKSIEGKTLMLAGFWNRRDAYHGLKVGDQLEVGLRHIGLRSDHLTVAEPIRQRGQQGARSEPSTPRATPRDEPTSDTDPRRGFRGMLVGRLVEKDVERGTFTITVDAVPRVWENNQTKTPRSLLGQNVAVEGVAGRMIDALVVTKIGDTIECGARHEDGVRLRLVEVLRKVGPVQPGDYPVLPDGFRGYRGPLVGKIVRKRAESWEVTLEVMEVGSPTEGSTARDPSSIIGQQVMLAGFWNRKDDFHALAVGETIRCGVTHPQPLSDHLTVVESIRKVE